MCNNVPLLAGGGGGGGGGGHCLYNLMCTKHETCVFWRLRSVQTIWWLLFVNKNNTTLRSMLSLSQFESLQLINNNNNNMLLIIYYIYISSRPPQSIKHTVDIYYYIIYIVIYTPQSITHFKWTYKWLNCLWLNKKHQEIIFDAFMINNLLHHVGNNDKQFFVSLWTGIIFLSIGSSTFIILNY